MRTNSLARCAASLAVVALAGCGSGTTRTTAVAGGDAAALRAPPGRATPAVAAPGSGGSLTAIARGGGAPSTRIAVIGRDGRTRAARVVAGSWRLPAAVRGRPEGISWNGSRVVLVAAANPGRFLALSVREQHAPTQIVEPRGRFLYDGLSADGTTLFLTQLASADGASTYRIMRYDLATGRLNPQPVVVKGEEGEAMVGEPVARAATADFIYTVYDRRPRPFIHALESHGRYSLCIDLPAAGDRGASAAWSARRVGSGVAIITNSVLRTAYRLVGGQLQSIAYAGPLE